MTKNNVKGSFKVIQGHVFGSMESLRGTPYSYIKMLTLSLKFPKIQPAKRLKIAVVDNPIVV